MSSPLRELKTCLGWHRALAWPVCPNKRDSAVAEIVSQRYRPRPPGRTSYCLVRKTCDCEPLIWNLLEIALQSAIKLRADTEKAGTPAGHDFYKSHVLFVDLVQKKIIAGARVTTSKLT